MPDPTFTPESSAPLSGGALLDSLLSTDVKEDTPVSVAPAPVDEPILDAPTPEGEAPPSDALTEEEPTEEEADKALEEAQTKADAANEPNNLDLRSPRGRTVYGDHKDTMVVARSLGFKPSPEDIQTWYASHGDLDAMRTDLLSAKPENVANFVQNMATQSPEGMSTLAGVLPEWIARQAVHPNGQIDPGYAQMYSRMATPILERKERALYERAETSADPELKRSLLHAAKVLEWDRTGKFRADPTPGETPPVPQRADPYAAERAQIERDRAELTQIRQSQSQAHIQQFVGATNQSIHSSVSGVADEALAPLKQSQTPEMYEILRDRLLSEVIANIPRNATDRYREYVNAYERAERSPSSESSAALARLYTSMAVREIQSLRAKYLKMATNGKTEASVATHAALARAASQVSPTTASSAAPRLAPKVPDGATADERRASMLTNILG